MLETPVLALPADLQLLLPRRDDASLDAAWHQVQAVAAADDLTAFGALQRDFAGALSRALTTDPAARAHPELVALGFWLRPAHLQRLMAGITRRADDPVDADAATDLALPLPRGLALHFAPGNVDTLFAYSWLVALLCGNRNLVRLSSRHSPQTQVLLTLLGRLLDEPTWSAIAGRVAVLRYDHDDAFSARLSSLCDVRVVWGGDAAVRSLRALPLPPHATELCFPDKTSLAVLQAEAVAALAPAALTRLAQGFAADAYSFGQRACSSPRVVAWLGTADAVAAAQAGFWPAVTTAAQRLHHGLGAAEAVAKEVAAALLAMDADVHYSNDGPSLVKRVWLDTPALHAQVHCGGGLFLETRITQLDALRPLLDRRVQTVATYGVPRQAWLDWVQQAGPRGIDRIVPLGQALDFAPVWDGLDLWQAFTRQLTLRT